MSSEQVDVADLLGPIRRIHERVRDAVVAQCERAALEELSDVADDESQGDTIYAIDRVSEELLVELFANEIATRAPIVLIAEGIGDVGKFLERRMLALRDHSVTHPFMNAPDWTKQIRHIETIAAHACSREACL